MLPGIAGLAPASSAGAAKAQPRNLEEAAAAFESLLLAQILKSCSVGAGEDQTSEAIAEMAQECFAQAISASGGLGLRSLIQSGLTK